MTISLDERAFFTIAVVLLLGGLLYYYHTKTAVVEVDPSKKQKLQAMTVCRSFVRGRVNFEAFDSVSWQDYEGAVINKLPEKFKDGNKAYEVESFVEAETPIGKKRYNYKCKLRRKGKQNWKLLMFDVTRP